MGYEEGTIHLVVGNFTPITFQATEETTIFVNEDLWSLQITLLGTRETRYRTTIFPIGRRLATEGEVMKKAKMDQAAQKTFRVKPYEVVK
jgi:hypothetical protein